MPIYEFYCAKCHTVFSFLSRKVQPTQRPSCPRCATPQLERRPSAFAISSGRSEEGAEDRPQVDEARLERAMASMAGELEGVDEDDPKAAARVMRKLYDAAGIPVGGGLAEALRRLEAGEDPESIESDLGDALDQDPLEGAPEGAAGRIAAMRRRFTPPTVDTELHEM